MHGGCRVAARLSLPTQYNIPQRKHQTRLGAHSHTHTYGAPSARFQLFEGSRSDQGGVMSITENFYVTFQDCKFLDNEADFGAVIQVRPSPPRPRPFFS